MVGVHAEASSGGDFVVVCGGAPWGTGGTLEEALALVAEAYHAGRLEPGSAVLVQERAPAPALKLVAPPAFLAVLAAER
jgi:hypothetical protein